MKYPASFVDSDGIWWTIFQGHDLSEGVIIEGLSRFQGARPEGGRIDRQEEHLHFTPRIKWCSRVDWGCDNDGEWHGHWFAVQPAAGTEFTIARWFAPLGTDMRTEG